MAREPAVARNTCTPFAERMREIAARIPVEGVPEIIESYCTWLPEDLAPDLGDSVQRTQVDLIDVLHEIIREVKKPGYFEVPAGADRDCALCYTLELLVRDPGAMDTYPIDYDPFNHSFTLHVPPTPGWTPDYIFQRIAPGLSDAFHGWRGSTGRHAVQVQHMAWAHAPSIVDSVMLRSGHGDLVSAMYGVGSRPNGHLRFHAEDVDKVRRLYPSLLRGVETRTPVRKKRRTNGPT
jgi:hypothetical protein